MFDELDDPAAPYPGDAARAAVAARATRLRRRRGAAWGGGAGAALLAVAAVVYGGPEPRALDTIVTETGSPDPSPTAEPSPAEPSPAEPTPTPSPRPTPTPSPTHPGPTRTPAPTTEPPEPPATTPPPRPTTAPPPFDQTPDGKPGWSTGMSWCRNATELPGQGTAPFPGLTLTLDLPATTFVSGRSYSARLVVENTGDTAVSFGAWLPGGTVAVDDAGHGSAGQGNDAYATHQVELEPGEAREFTVGVVTYGCGDTPRDGDVPLPPGTYRMTHGLRWSERATWDGPIPSSTPTMHPGSGEWYVAPVAVRMTESG